MASKKKFKLIIIISVVLILIILFKCLSLRRKYSRELLDAVQKDDIVRTQELLTHFWTDINYKLNTLIEDPMGTGLFAEYPIYWAVHNKNFKIFKLLIENGADLRSVNSDGSILFNRVVSANLPKFVTYLIEKGVDINEGDNYKFARPLRYACDIPDSSCIEAVKILIENGANINPIGDGPTPLLRAISNGHFHVVKLLVDHGADINAIVDGNPVIVKAAIRNKYEIVSYLLDKGVNPACYYNTGTPLLTCLSEREGIPVIKKILNKNSDINIIDFKNGENALMHREDTVVIKFLIENGININHKNKEGQTALDIAKEKNYKDAVDMLIRYGAK